MLLYDRKKAAEALQKLYEALMPYGEFDGAPTTYLDLLKDELVKKGYIDDDLRALD